MDTLNRIHLFLLALSACAVACAPAPNPEAEPREGPNLDALGQRPRRESLADPREYLRVHNIASDTEHEGWRSAIEALAIAGDAFTLEHLGRVDRGSLSEANLALLEKATSRVNLRVQQQKTPLGANFVVARLERAAYADLMCDALEDPLKTWTLKAIESELQDPAVVVELQCLEGGYTPSVDLETMFSSMGERVPWYAQQLLKSAGENVDRP